MQGSTTVASKLAMSPMEYHCSHIHLFRRIQHSFTGILFLCLSYILPLHFCSILLFLGTFLLYIHHLLRKKFKRVQELYITMFGTLLRKHELYDLPGAFYFLLGECGCCYCHFYCYCC